MGHCGVCGEDYDDADPVDADKHANCGKASNEDLPGDDI